MNEIKIYLLIGSSIIIHVFFMLWAGENDQKLHIFLLSNIGAIISIMAIFCTEYSIYYTITKISEFIKRYNHID